MITFMITYEIRMDSQVTLIALIFFKIVPNIVLLCTIKMY